MSGFEDKPVLNAKYRNRNEIIASILEAAKGVGISKIRIMFTAYLSYEQLKNQAEEDSNDGNTEQDISEEDGETTTTQ